MFVNSDVKLATKVCRCRLSIGPVACPPVFLRSYQTNFSYFIYIPTGPLKMMLQITHIFKIRNQPSGQSNSFAYSYLCLS